MAATLREVLMDSRWTPGKLQVNSRYCVWSLFGLLMESIRMRGSVSRAPSYDGEILQQGEVPSWMTAEHTIWFRDPPLLVLSILSNPNFKVLFYSPLDQ